ncbi:hypothetical protein FrEUN1fDRAFT_3745 [Parafrankia sp. EUN1f]|nr:hypothetical protein FrEUN1fDRAFT_3745 [Parafrankia sp. EUN1f]
MTDTNSLQAVSAPSQRRGPGRSEESPADAAPTGRFRAARANKAASGAPEVEDPPSPNRRSAARGAGRASRDGDGAGLAGRSRGDSADSVDSRGGHGETGRGSRGGRGRDAGTAGGGGRAGAASGSGSVSGSGTARGGAAADRRGTRAVGVLEPADFDDEPDEPSLPQDRLAWLRHGWIGPLGIALVVSLLVVGLYTVLVGGGGEKSPQDAATANPSPATQVATSQEAIAGKAMVNGTWRCRLQNESATNGDMLGDVLPDVLVVPAAGLTYTWNDTPGTYTISPSEGDRSGSTISRVEFTSGPLAGVPADHLLSEMNSGAAQGTLYLQPVANDPSKPRRYCYVN